MGHAHKHVPRGKQGSEAGVSIPRGCRISVLLLRGLAPAATALSQLQYLLPVLARQVWSGTGSEMLLSVTPAHVFVKISFRKLQSSFVLADYLSQDGALSDLS